jgi:hypothetical protein
MLESLLNRVVWDKWEVFDPQTGLPIVRLPAKHLAVWVAWAMKAKWTVCGQGVFLAKWEVYTR